LKTIDQIENIKLQEYLQDIIGKPTPFSKQKSMFGTLGNCLWCDEWELIEMIKYLFNGKEVYYRDPAPNRLKNSPFWSKEAIEAKVEKDLGNMTTIEEIIGYFKNIRNSFNDTTSC